MLAEHEAIDVKLAAHEATFLETTQQWIVKYEKVPEGGIDKGEFAILEAEIVLWNAGFTRR